MPTEVAMMACSMVDVVASGGGGGGASVSRFSAETMSGAAILVAPNGRRQHVNVAVYQTSLEHFAVLYPQKKICRPLGVVNIRTTTVERLAGGAGFTVRQHGFDAPMALTFLCDCADLDAWMRAFARSPPAPSGGALPRVEEGDGEEA